MGDFAILALVDTIQAIAMLSPMKIFRNQVLVGPHETLIELYTEP